MSAEKFEKYLKAESAKVRISGSGTYDGKVLRSSGSCSVTGNLNVNEVSSSGSFKCDGNITVENTFISSGSARVIGSLKTGNVKTSGSFSVGGDVEVRDEARFSGSVHVGGDVKCTTLKASGSIRARNIKADVIRISGSVTAEKIEGKCIRIECYGTSMVAEIKGDEVILLGRLEETVINFFGILKISRKSRKGILRTEKIAGCSVELEYVECKEVYGEDITIGEGSIVRDVYYVRNLRVDPKATVTGKCTKIEKLETS